MIKIKVLFLLILISLSSAWPSEKNPDVKTLVKSLLLGKMQNSSRFNTKGCQQYDAQWMAFFIFQQPFVATYQFAANCDIQGTIPISSPGPFPLELKVRHLEGVEQVKMNMTLATNLEQQIVTLTASKGKLSGKKNHYFSANYQVKLDIKNGKIAVLNEKGTIDFYSDNSYKKKIATETIGK